MCLGHTDWVGSGTGHSLGTSQGMLTPARGAKCLGEGLRKLLHPQLWFLVGPVVAAGVWGGEYLSLFQQRQSNKSLLGHYGNSSKGAKNKTHLSFDRYWLLPGCCEKSVQTTPQFMHLPRTQTHTQKQSSLTNNSYK